MSVRDVEEITGINFFYLLPDDIEEMLETTFDTSKWSFRLFTPTGETADVVYVAPTQSESEKIKQLILTALYEMKKAVFEYTGTTKIAKELGLI